jgi:hypothetical protein
MSAFDPKRTLTADLFARPRRGLQCPVLAQSRHAHCADECPLLRAKRTMTNRCLPISIYEYGLVAETFERTRTFPNMFFCSGPSEHRTNEHPKGRCSVRSECVRAARGLFRRVPVYEEMRWVEPKLRPPPGGAGQISSAFARGPRRCGNHHKRPLF